MVMRDRRKNSYAFCSNFIFIQRPRERNPIIFLIGTLAPYLLAHSKLNLKNSILRREARHFLFLIVQSSSLIEEHTLFAWKNMVFAPLFSFN